MKPIKWSAQILLDSNRLTKVEQFEDHIQKIYRG